MKKLMHFIIISLLISCAQKLPVISDFGNDHYKLVNQNNEIFIFPDNVSGKIVVMNFIYTNCPDICPLSTNNIRLIQERLDKEKINDVHFVSLSFDPKNDTPGVLTKFAAVRNLNLGYWDFLTGEKSVTDALINKAGVLAVPDDSTTTKEGKKIYSFVHTDRISLIDQEGRIRKNYTGSQINIDEIVNDIRMLE